MTQPAFSIIIPTYNRAGFIVNTIKSVLAQTYSDLEIIVIDDGSTDHTEDVVTSMKDARIRYVKKTNGERGAARNAGVKLAKGRFVNFLDSDDSLYPNHTETARNFIQTDPDVKVFHLGYDVKTLEGKFIRDSSNIRDINKQILSGNLVGVNGVFIERQLALDNPFSEVRALSEMEDWELWLRVAAKYKFPHSPKTTCTIINHDQRSVVSADTEKIKTKTALFIGIISGSQDLKSAFGRDINKTIASALTYAALHLAIAKADTSDILTYLLRGLRVNPGEIFKKRFLVILKLLVFR